jgi:hypothetical protein
MYNFIQSDLRSGKMIPFLSSGSATLQLAVPPLLCECCAHVCISPRTDPIPDVLDTVL